jgi:hypothetical protein
MLFNSDLPKFLFDERITWGVTLDGFINNDLKNLQTGIDLDIVKANIINICNKYGANKMYLNYTLNEQNFYSLKNFIDFADFNGIKNLYLTEMKIFSGFKNTLEEYKFNHSKNGSQLKDLEKYARSLNFKHVYFGTILTKKGYSRCYEDNNFNPIIDIDGSVSFCYGREEKIIGNIEEKNIYEKWLKLLKVLQTNINGGNKWCANCCTKTADDGYFPISSKIYPYLDQK